MRIESVKWDKDFEGVGILASTAEYTFIDREDWEHQGEESAETVFLCQACGWEGDELYMTNDCWSVCPECASGFQIKRRF